IALLDRRQLCINQQQINCLVLDARRQGLGMAAADKGRWLDFADLDDLGKDNVEPDGLGQTLEFGLTRLNGMLREVPPYIRHHNADTERPVALVNKRLWAALLDGLVVVIKFVHVNSLVTVLRLLGIEQLDWRAWHDCRDGVLVDKLRLRIAAQ